MGLITIGYLGCPKTFGVSKYLLQKPLFRSLSDRINKTDKLMVQIADAQIAASRGAAAAPAPGMPHPGPAMPTQMPHPGAPQA